MQYGHGPLVVDGKVARLSCRSTGQGARTHFAFVRGASAPERRPAGRTHWYEYVRLGDDEAVAGVRDISNSGRHQCFVARISNQVIIEAEAQPDGLCPVCDE